MKSAGFQMRTIDRFMRSPYAEIAWSALAACSIVATLVIYSDIEMNLSQVLYVLRTRSGPLVVFGLLFAIGGWWTVRTWRRLWRRGRSPWEHIVYDYGVRGFGFGLATALIVIFALIDWKSESGPPDELLAAGGALAAIFFGTPVALNLGYFWGAAYAASIGAEKDPKIEKGEPPLLEQTPRT